MSLSKIQIFKEKDFSSKTLSHSAHYAPSQYEKCSFENANMNSVMFENTHF